MATHCRDCSRRAGRIIHPDKQEFSLMDSRPGRPTFVTAEVPRHTGSTSDAPPEVIGIPILPELPLLRVASKTRVALDRARKDPATVRPAPFSSSTPCTPSASPASSTPPQASSSHPRPSTPTKSHAAPTATPSASPRGRTRRSSTSPFTTAAWVPPSWRTVPPTASSLVSPRRPNAWPT